jgi:hypothetical protein
MKTIKKVTGVLNGVTIKDIPMAEYYAGGLTPNGMRAVSSTIKKYVLAKYLIKVQVSSSTFSMGDSVNVYFDPRTLTVENYKKISAEIESIFQTYQYDYYADCQGTKGTPKTYVAELDAEFGITTKYISCNYRPNYDTKLHASWEAEGKPAMIDPTTVDDSFPTDEEVMELLNSKEEIKEPIRKGNRAPIEWYASHEVIEEVEECSISEESKAVLMKAKELADLISDSALRMVLDKRLGSDDIESEVTEILLKTQNYSMEKFVTKQLLEAIEFIKKTLK